MKRKDTNLRLSLNWKNIMITLFFIILFIELYGLMLDYFTMPSLIQLKTDQTLTFLSRVWSVQSSVSLLSITLISLITPRIDLEIYGLKIKDLLYIERKIFLNYWEKVILAFLLIVTNLYYVSQVSIHGTNIIFISSSLIIILLFRDTFEIFLNYDNMDQEIREFMKNGLTNASDEDDYNYSTNLITNFKDNIIKLILQGDMKEYNDNINFFYDIYGYIHDKEVLVNVYNDLYQSISETLLREGYYNRFKKSVNTLLLKNRSLIKNPNANYNLNQVIKISIESFTEIDNYLNPTNFINLNLHKFISERFMQYNILENPFNKFELLSILKKIYHSSIEIKPTMIPPVSIIEDYIVSFSPLNNLNDDDYYISSNMLFEIGRNTILNNNSRMFKYLINSLMKHNHVSISSEKTRLYDVLGTFVVYLYYLGFKEKTLASEYRLNIKEYLNINVFDEQQDRKPLKVFISESKGILWKYYHSIKNELNYGSWEYMGPDRSKKVVLETKIINEFFIFYSINTITEYNIDYLDGLTISEIISLLSFIDDEGFLLDKYIEDYNTFCTWFDFDKDKVRNKPLYEKLVTRYRKEFFETLELLKQDDNKENFMNTIERIKTNICEEMDDNIFTNKFYDYPDNSISLVKSFILPVDVVLKEWVFISNSIVDMTSKELEDRIISILKDNSIKIIYEPDEDKKFIDSLFKKINTHKGITPNTLMNKKLSNNFRIEYHETEEDIKKLRTFERSLNYIGKIGNGDNTHYYDSNKFKPNMKVDDILIRRMNQSDIQKEINLLLSSKENDIYNFKTDDNIIIELTEEELVEYFNTKFRIIDINILLSIESEYPSGYFIEYI